MMNTKIKKDDVQRVLDSYSEPTQKMLIFLRTLIFDVANETEGVGTIEETLKWGQMSYLTHRPKSGTTIRMDEHQKGSQAIALFVHCQTTLVESFQQMYPDLFEYEGTRAIIFSSLNDEQVEALKHFIEMALTYHQWKNTSAFQ